MLIALISKASVFCSRVLSLTSAASSEQSWKKKTQSKFKGCRWNERTSFHVEISLNRTMNAVRLCARTNTLHGSFVAIEWHFVFVFSSSTRAVRLSRDIFATQFEWNGTNFMWEIRQYERINCKIYVLAQRFRPLSLLFEILRIFFSSGSSEVRIVPSYSHYDLVFAYSGGCKFSVVTQSDIRNARHEKSICGK